MRVTAKPSRSTKEIKVDVGSLPPAAHASVDTATLRAETLAIPGRAARRATLALVLGVVAMVAMVAIVLVVVWLRPSDSPDSGTSPPPATPPPTATATTGGAGTPTPRPSTTATPSATATATLPPGGSEEGSDEGSGVAIWAWAVGGVGALAVIAVLSLWVVRRRAARRGALTVPGGSDAETLPAGVDQPRASLGTPDVLILTETATEDDARLRERVRDQRQAIFANVQLACNFYPTEDWVFSSARLTVVLAREDGRQAPAPIAYSLRPLSDRDGSAREQSVEIGADMKFVSVKGGEKSTGPGEEFVRGYGLQESVSYWEFTATQHQPLQGSFVLWLIARAPRESDLTVSATLQVRVAPRSVWSRADAPAVAGTGGVSLVLGLKGGPPYQARLTGSAPEDDTEPWLVDAR